MKYFGYKAVAFAAAAAVFVQAPTAAWAVQSPEFAYTAEKWASLKDDNLEYDEIPDLIHEYNATVLQNAISYREYIGKDVNDITREDYYEKANEIYSNMEEPDPESDNYSSRVSSYLSSQVQADKLVEQGDKNTDDAETYKLTYDQEEKTLVSSAQLLMISYYSQMNNLNTLNQNIITAENNLEAAKNKLSAGTGTQSSVLTAEQAVSSAKASLLSAQSSLDQTKQDLIIMLGWSYGADVKIGALPEVTDEMIAAIDNTADIQTAIDNNYALKKTDKQLANAHNGTVIQTLTTQRADSVKSISNDVASGYQNLILAQSNYKQAKEAFELQKTALETAERKKTAGTITKNSYNSVLASYNNAQTTLESKRLAMLTAYVTYQWDVNGLADA